MSQDHIMNLTSNIINKPTGALTPNTPRYATHLHGKDTVPLRPDRKWILTQHLTILR